MIKTKANHFKDLIPQQETALPYTECWVNWVQLEPACSTTYMQIRSTLLVCS
jgi:hypothetical protein